MPKPIFLEGPDLLKKTTFLNEIESGLLSDSAFIEPKFLYDNLGSHLFSSITLLPEYYPTKTEKSIFIKYAQEIAEAIGLDKTLIDLGAGDCQKAAFLFNSIKPSSYVAIDFSIDYLANALIQLQNKYPDIVMYGVGTDFSHELILPSQLNIALPIFFYPGSSIGNFSSVNAENFLKGIKKQSTNGGLLMGMDLMKDEAILKAAYDDPLKITAAFNLNILRSINNLINTNFDVSQFRHVTKINHEEKRVELYLEAIDDLTVLWAKNHRHFKKGELIHTENSHKYTLDSIKNILDNSGFNSYKIWTDPAQYFALIYAQ